MRGLADRPRRSRASRRRRGRPTSRAARVGCSRIDRQPLGHAARHLARAARAPRGARARRRSDARDRDGVEAAAAARCRRHQRQYIEPMFAAAAPRTARWLAPSAAAAPLAEPVRGLPRLGRARRLCADCVGRFAAPRPRCAPLRAARCRPARRAPAAAACAEPPPFDAHASPPSTTPIPWDGLITRFKFHGRARPGAAPLARAHRAERASRRRRRRRAPAPARAAGAASAARLRERGYNQAWELARRLARALGLPRRRRACCCASATRRTSSALPPTNAPPTCAAPSRSSRARARELRGRAVALVDDVMTTGATARGDARVLQRAGAASVARLGRRAHAAPGRTRLNPPMFNIVLVAPGDPAQHRQRDPPGRQHRLRAAPGRAARLLDGRHAAAPRRARLPRVRRGAPPRLVGGASSQREAPTGRSAVRLHDARHGEPFARRGLGSAGDWLVFGTETAGLPGRSALDFAGVARCACRCAPASAA